MVKALKIWIYIKIVMELISRMAKLTGKLLKFIVKKNVLNEKNSIKRTS